MILRSFTTMSIGVAVLLILLQACESTLNPHETYLRDGLARVSYDNGISIIEAKVLADTYLYLYASSPGKIPHARISDDRDFWVGEIYGGASVSPSPLGLPDVKINKLNGVISWAGGPTIDHINLPEKSAIQ